MNITSRSLPPGVNDNIYGKLFISIGAINWLKYGKIDYLNDARVHTLSFQFKFWGDKNQKHSLT
jgi:hypothetical protein